MKLGILLALAVSAIFASSANATEINFLADSKLPSYLRSKVIEAVESQCSPTAYALQEIKTAVSIQTIDQGKHDYHYETIISATYDFDGVHPVSAIITVKSAEYAFYNPSVERLEVLSVASNPKDLCF